MARNLNTMDKRQLLQMQLDQQNAITSHNKLKEHASDATQHKNVLRRLQQRLTYIEKALSRF